jgi:hypothetical protein
MYSLTKSTTRCTLTVYPRQCCGLYQNVLPHQRSLQTFTMCLSNRMGIHFYDCMAQALVKNSSLDRLSLCATDEDDKTCFRALSAIARALKANNTLTSINISTLKFSRKAMGELVQGLNQNSHLKSLSLCHTNIDNALLSILAETMRNHRSITDLHLNCNPVNDIDPTLLLASIQRYTASANSCWGSHSKGVLRGVSFEPTTTISEHRRGQVIQTQH